MINKIRYCKCGHLLNPDHKKQNNILGIKFKSLTSCNKCCCHTFVRRSYPTRLDTVMTWLLVGVVSFIIIFLGISAYAVNLEYHELLIKDPTNILHKTFLTIGSVFKLLPIGLTLLTIYLFCSFIFDPLTSHLRMKKKETKPVVIEVRHLPSVQDCKYIWVCVLCDYIVRDTDPSYEYLIAAHNHQLIKYERQEVSK